MFGLFLVVSPVSGVCRDCRNAPIVLPEAAAAELAQTFADANKQSYFVYPKLTSGLQGDSRFDVGQEFAPRAPRKTVR